MKSLIVLVALLSFSVYGQTAAPSEPSWKTSLRHLIAQVSPEWSEKLLGKEPVPTPAIVMPEIPKDFKSNTDASTYDKAQKELTEFDRLPAERKRQFDYKFLQELFRATRKSEPRDEDLANWLNTLDQGGSREGVYQALVLDEVYATLENLQEKASDRLVTFSMDFAKKYLGLNYKMETLSQYNLFTLKRIMTEKALDLMEYYETKEVDSMYRWYALFSAQLAQDYAPLLKNSLREEPSAEFHYQWAKGMPIQHIKSEIIIKLHTVMNGLQLLQ